MTKPNPTKTSHHVHTRSAEALRHAGAIFNAIQTMMVAGLTIDQMDLMSLCEIGGRICGLQAEIAQDAADEEKND
ncbi:hypothetical protein [Burkholderia gladioli]|uniref:hypothetical protein n=1 Tax=Burkholderia gladioli TaxID=28095 RepID=UPI0016418B58|nr:hypothetical protein [Burkholderia gladioli]